MDIIMNSIRNAAQETTWDDIIDAHAHHFPQRAALAFKDITISYERLRRLVDECARLFTEAGIKAGDTVALLSPPRPDAMVTCLAAAKIGAIWVGLNPRYQNREIVYVIDHARPKLLISVASFESRDYDADIHEALESVPSEHAPTLALYDGSQATHDALFASLRNARITVSPVHGDSAATETASAKGPCMLVYTSGTTGKPKGVLLGHREMIFRSSVQAKTFHTRSHPVVINFAPINHIGGMHFRGLSQIRAGGTIVYQDRYRPADVMDLIAQHNVNVLMLGSTMLQMLLEEPSFDIKVLRKMEWFIFSGSAIPMPILKQLGQYCPKIGSTYGSTESCGSVSYVFTPDSLEDMAYTIGRSLPAGQLRVAGAQGESIPLGEQGELQVQKDYCMQGYLRDAKATADAFTPDGWMKTGDLAICKPDGAFQLVGRIKEMYKSGGYNVYPREVEMVIEAHPDILLCAVIPIDDVRYQQVGHAYVITKHGADLTDQALSTWCRERLANYKVPKRIHIRASLPMLPIGKVDKLALQAQSRGA